MLLIQNITDNPNQTQAIILPDGTSFSMTMYFVPMQVGWFLTNFTYQSFTLQGLRICNNPNMLNQWKNLLPFGLACFSKANREPTQQQDFSSGNSQLYVLTAAEVAEYTAFLQAG